MAYAIDETLYVTTFRYPPGYSWELASMECNPWGIMPQEEKAWKAGLQAVLGYGPVSHFLATIALDWSLEFAGFH